jgi:hypothetical protein
MRLRLNVTTSIRAPSHFISFSSRLSMGIPGSLSSHRAIASAFPVFSVDFPFHFNGERKSFNITERAGTSCWLNDLLV